MHGLPSDPSHPALQGGDEVTEIPSSELERPPTTEEIRNQESQLDKRRRDPGDRSETAGQTEQQVIRQTDRETQMTSSCEMEKGGATQPLDLDGEVEMKGGDNGEAEAQHNNGLEGIDEPPLPTLSRENVIKSQENEVDMQEEGGT